VSARASKVSRCSCPERSLLEIGGLGAKNMAVVRRFALGLVRANKSKGSVKTTRKLASWNIKFLLEILQMK
jgi:hypothetical protein